MAPLLLLLGVAAPLLLRPLLLHLPLARHAPLPRQPGLR